MTKIMQMMKVLLRLISNWFKLETSTDEIELTKLRMCILYGELSE